MRPSLAAFACVLAGCGGATSVAGGQAIELVDAAAEDAASDGSHDAGGAVDAAPDTTADVAPDVPVGSFCGGKAGLSCAPDQFCDDPLDRCGGADTGGACAPRPGFCPGKAAPACGCDGKVYKSACDAYVSGVDVASSGCAASETPQGRIPCGPTYCDVTTSYCRFSASDVAGVPSAWDCVGLPTGCKSATSTCASCFQQGTPCGAQCTVVPGGGVSGFRLDCPGG